MSRFDRFGKLEHSRTPAAEPERPKPALGRFESDAPPVRSEPAPEPLAAAAPVPATAPAPLERFAADGGQHTRLEEDPLAKLGFRRCASCNTDNGKWDTHCRDCRAPLDSPEAIALNVSLLEGQQVEREQEAARRRDASVKEIMDHADAMLRKQRADAQGFSLSHAKGLKNLLMAVFGVVFVVLGMVVRSFPWTFIFLGLGVVLLGLRFPGLFSRRWGRRGWW